MRLLLPLCLLGLSGCLRGAVRDLGSDFMVKPYWRAPPWSFGLPPSQPLAVRTDDALRLEGELFRPAGPPKGLVLFIHGRDAGRRQGDRAVRAFLSKGWAVAVYDQRAHGRSEGATMTYGAREVGDAQRVLDAAGIEPVVVMGVSMGAAVSLQLAAKDPRVKAVIAAAPFADLMTEWRDAAPRALVSQELFDEAATLAQQKAGFDATVISPEHAAATLNVPVMLLHGLDDPLIDPAHSRRILRALGDHGALYLLEGVRHDDVIDHDEVWTAIDGWWATHVDTPRIAGAQ